MKFLSIVCSILIFSACNEKTENGAFVVEGQLKNVNDQKIILEQLFFTNQSPEVLDTAVSKNGAFTVKGIAEEQSMFRIKLNSSNSSFIFINDESRIPFVADLKQSGTQAGLFNTRANLLLRNFLAYIERERIAAEIMNSRIEHLKTTPNADSLIAAETLKLNNAFDEFKSYLVKYIDTVSNPVVAMFALGYSQGIEESSIKPVVSRMSKRFPQHKGVAALVSEYDKLITAEKPQQTPEIQSGGPAIGTTAPDLQMKDTSGKSFSLSNLKGKYVLVDFWASWCGPCRMENPNVVSAYEKFKSKNFTVLGVSLDKEKSQWIQAINNDRLTWHHISDLQYWNSAAVSLYGFDGIPFNVLVDPQGKIIAKDLREGMLHSTLASVLK